MVCGRVLQEVDPGLSVCLSVLQVESVSAGHSSLYKDSGALVAFRGVPVYITRSCVPLLPT